MTYVVLNGQLTAGKNAHIALNDRGFRYGDGVFDTLRVQAGAVYQLAWHMRRLSRGLERLRIPFDVKTLPPLCNALLKKNKVKDGLLRIQITRGVGGRGYLPDANATPTLLIETLEKPVIPDAPVSLWLTDMQKIASEALPVQFKICQGVNSTLARLEAADNQCFDALMLNAKKQVCETSSGNIFWVKGGELYTPSLSCGVLEGSMRAALLRLSPYKIHEVETTVETLTDATSVFICNTAWGVLAVESLQPAGLRWASVNAAKKLQALLDADIDHDTTNQH